MDVPYYDTSNATRLMEINFESTFPNLKAFYCTVLSYHHSINALFTAISGNCCLIYSTYV
jgi:hypothetical protein